jgi:uncharacterized protein YbcI
MPEPDTKAELDRSAGGTVTMEISREMVSLMKEYLGRGPTRARTYVRDNLVVCVMQDTMTKAERSLVAGSNQHQVREIRRLFQDSLRDDAIAIVERIMGRKVLSFMGDHDIESDITAELFVLEPGLGEGVAPDVG